MSCEMKFGVKVNLKKDFSLVKESLTRMGIVSTSKKVITPTCYLYYENGKYYVCHFKELLSMFDDCPDKLSEKDTNRRNAICTLLENWGLIECIDNVYQEILEEKIFVLPYQVKKDQGYEINHKFSSFTALKEHRDAVN